MKSNQYRAHYTRNLPHYQPKDANLFVTFRLAGSLPAKVLDSLRKQKIGRGSEPKPAKTDLSGQLLAQDAYFLQLDASLDSATTGPTWLKRPKVAQIVYESLLNRDKRVCDIDVFSILSNHVHVVLRPYNDKSGNPIALTSIMMSLKRRTATESNKVLARSGQFWQHESYDHVIRDRDEWERIIKYVIDNPVSAGLVDDWQSWPWTYLRSD